MPIYDYLCTSCDHRADILHGIHDPGPTFCPSCGAEGAMRKQFAAPAIHFKGSGWAKKDRGGSSMTKAAASGSSKSGDGGEGSSSAGAGSTGSGSGDGGSGSSGSDGSDGSNGSKGSNSGSSGNSSSSSASSSGD